MLNEIPNEVGKFPGTWPMIMSPQVLSLVYSYSKAVFCIMVLSFNTKFYPEIESKYPYVCGDHKLQCIDSIP